jgi:hypothetical protein
MQITVNTRRAAAALGLMLFCAESGLLSLVSANRSGETGDPFPAGTGGLSWRWPRVTFRRNVIEV